MKNISRTQILWTKGVCLFQQIKNGLRTKFKNFNHIIWINRWKICWVFNYCTKFQTICFTLSPLIGLFLLRDQSEALFTYGLVNFSMNFWTSQRSSERSSQHSRKSYMKSTVTRWGYTNTHITIQWYIHAVHSYFN